MYMHSLEMATVKAAWAIVIALDNGLPENHARMINANRSDMCSWLLDIVWC